MKHYFYSLFAFFLPVSRKCLVAFIVLSHSLSQKVLQSLQIIKTSSILASFSVPRRVLLMLRMIMRIFYHSIHFLFLLNELNFDFGPNQITNIDEMMGLLQLLILLCFSLSLRKSQGSKELHLYTPHQFLRKNKHHKPNKRKPPYCDLIFHF